MENAGVGPDEIGLIVLATVTPDMPLPATACTVQHELGCRKAAAFDLSAGCSGFIYAQSVAKQFVVSGRCRHVLVIGAELLSKFVDWKDRTTCVLFADGAGAVVMSSGDPPRGVLSSAMYADGSGFDFICMPGGGALHPPNDPSTLEQHLPFIKMKGNETFKMAVRSMDSVCREVLTHAGLTTSDVDWLVPHQANRRIISAVGNRLGIPEERCYVNIERFGNTSSASIPIALAEAVDQGKIKQGDVVLMTAFGAGLTWGASVVRW
jgi:3-oxoacyl-[acyl-carrier-protein] synthase-3